LSQAESTQIECNSQVLTPGEPNKASIPPARRRAVMIRDGHRCQAKGCRSTSFLEMHHLKPRSRGGDNREGMRADVVSSDVSDAFAVKLC